MIVRAAERNEEVIFLALSETGLLCLWDERGIQLMHEELDNLVKTIAAYSYETYQHSVNVGVIAAWIGNFLGLSKSQVLSIKYAGLLHDIGKIKIDLKILNKPEKLTAGEWAIVKKHTEYGVDILSPHPWAEPFIQLVNYHHERWDGNGYYGIPGKDIPLGARIIALADAFDAMTSSRPYSQIKNWNQSLKELEKFSGTQFDPYLVVRMIQASSKLFIKKWDGVFKFETKQFE